MQINVVCENELELKWNELSSIECCRHSIKVCGNLFKYLFTFRHAHALHASRSMFHTQNNLWMCLCKYWIVCRCEGHLHISFCSTRKFHPFYCLRHPLSIADSFLWLSGKSDWNKKPLYHPGKFWCQARFWTWQQPHSAGTHKWEMLHKSPLKVQKTPFLVSWA